LLLVLLGRQVGQASTATVGVIMMMMMVEVVMVEVVMLCRRPEGHPIAHTYITSHISCCCSALSATQQLLLVMVFCLFHVVYHHVVLYLHLTLPGIAVLTLILTGILTLILITLLILPIQIKIKCWFMLMLRGPLCSIPLPLPCSIPFLL
jgi:hypothetical protein